MTVSSYFQENTLRFFDTLHASKANTKFGTFYLCGLLTVVSLRLFYIVSRHVVCDV